MPGLVGFVKPDASADDAGVLLSRMERALEFEDRFERTCHHEPGAGLGRVGLAGIGSSEVIWNQERTRCLVMEGELHDTASLKQALSPAERECAPNTTAALLLRLYERLGLDVLTRLNGAFVVAIWDRLSRQLTLFNDRMGLFPLYYAHTNGNLLFASGVRALLADPELNRTVDLVAINQFLVYDHVLDDRTLLDSVRLLPQGSILTFREGRLAIRPYWTLRYPDVYQPQTEGACVEQFVHYLRQAVVRQRPNGRPAGVLLSGGLDSRLLLAPLREIDSRVQTLTFGIPGCDDARFARQAATTLHARHHFLELKPDWLLALADEAVRLTDGLGNIVNLHALATAEAQAHHAGVLYKGFMGDAMFGFALKRQMWADYRPDTRDEVHWGIHAYQGLLNYDAAEQKKLLTDSFRARVGDAPYDEYRNGLNRARVPGLANQRLHFDLTQRVPRMTINGVEVVRSRAIVRLPFCDNDLVEFASTVPPGFLFERYLAREALIRYFPRLAKVPVAATGRPLMSCARDLLTQTRTLVAWHLRDRGLAWLAPRERRPYKDYDRWFRTVLRPWMEGTLLSDRALDRGYFNPAYVRQLVAEHAGGANHGTRIGALLTLELWHRQFLD